MSENTFPFRRETRMEVLAIPVTAPGAPLQPVAVDKAKLAEYGVASFKWFNPTQMVVWLRGWTTGGTPTDISRQGHGLPPGALEVNSTQFPDMVAVVASDEPDVRCLDGVTVGTGSFLYPGRVVFMTYGGGV